MNRPNLFDYATHELSQDAVLIWLFRYADALYSNDVELHQVAQNFVRLFLGDYDRPIKDVKVRKQWEHIDITVEINGDIGLVIEDKAGAHLHGDQLRCYKTSAEKWTTDQHLKLGLFYLNTENPNTDDRRNVEKEHFSIIKRSELLRVLNGYSGSNAILCDFRDKLKTAEIETESYKTLPAKDWTSRAWQGFYDWIHSIRSDSTWEWVQPPRSNGFWGMWWNNHSECIRQEVRLYPQIDQGRFAFKMYCESDYNKDWAYRLRNCLEEIARELGIEEIHRPARMSFQGPATTLLVVDREKYLGSGPVNLNAVEQKFNLYERMIAMCKARFQNNPSSSS